MTTRSSWHCCCGQFTTPQRERSCTACLIVELTTIGLQGVLEGAEATTLAAVAQKRASEPLRAKSSQLPCDHGLFGDEHLQLDLVEMLQEPVNED